MLPVNIVAQTSDASLDGIVSDPSGASISQVTVTVRNNGTGISTTALSNESGAYHFASLQTGSYTISAQSSGFEAQVYDLKLDLAEQIRLNFTLRVAPQVRTLDVTTIAPGDLPTTSASS